MTTQERREFNNLNARAIELQDGIVEAVAAIDQTDSNRIALQETLDSVRATLEAAYGEDLTEDVNNFLGIETVDGEVEDEDDLDEDDLDEDDK